MRTFANSYILGWLCQPDKMLLCGLENGVRGILHFSYDRSANDTCYQIETVDCYGNEQTIFVHGNREAAEMELDRQLARDRIMSAIIVGDK